MLATDRATSRSTNRSLVNFMIVRPLTLLLMLSAPGNASDPCVRPVLFEQIVQVSPWTPVLDWAEQARATLEEAGDCSYVLAKRELVGGKLLDREQYHVKVRNQPYSVYLRGVSPGSVAGREAIYVTGQHSGKMLVNPGGIKRRLLGTLKLMPTSQMVMKHSRYPITASGPLKLVDRLVEMGRRELNLAGCELKQYAATADGQSCNVFEIAHADRDSEFEFARVLVYVDDARGLPIMFQAYDWSGNLVEEYQFRQLRVGRGFTGHDFDPANPHYEFPR